jgi:Repeat of unknown function (DUF346)
MALTTNGLANGGLTTHYQIQYDDSLSAADGRDRGNALIPVCEADYNLISGWFGGISLTVGTPITVNIIPGPYASASWGPPITLIPGNGSSLALVRYLLVSEVTEMFMLAQNKGWFGTGNEGSAGEGLSRFLAGQFLIANGLGVTEPGFALANSWMTSPRSDYVNNVDPLDHGIDAKTGCAILFIYYLFAQLGFSINSIIAAAASELSGVNKDLTGDSNDPFPAFWKLLNASFPGTTAIPGSNPDNPFPLREEQQHVFYRGSDGAINHIFWHPSNQLFHDQWTQLTGAPAAAGDPATMVWPNQQHVFYRGMDGAIDHIFWDAPSNQLFHDDWTESTGAPAAAGDPATMVTTVGRGWSNQQHVFYRGTDGAINHIFWDAPSNQLFHDEWTESTGAPAAAGDSATMVWNLLEDQK